MRIGRPPRVWLPIGSQSLAFASQSLTTPCEVLSAAISARDDVDSPSQQAGIAETRLVLDDAQQGYHKFATIGARQDSRPQRRRILKWRSRMVVDQDVSK